MLQSVQTNTMSQFYSLIMDFEPLHSIRLIFSTIFANHHKALKPLSLLRSLWSYINTQVSPVLTVGGETEERRRRKMYASKWKPTFRSLMESVNRVPVYDITVILEASASYIPPSVSGLYAGEWESFMTCRPTQHNLQPFYFFFIFIFNTKLN